MTDAQDRPASPLPAGLDPRLAAAAASKMISAAIGDICVVMSRSPAHKHYSLADIEWKVMPAVLSGQFYIAEAEHREHGVRAPVAVVTWARVSEDVDRRLRENLGTPIRLRPDEWVSGDRVWLVDIAGDPPSIGQAFKVLMAGGLKDQPVQLAIRGEDGRMKVETLQGLATATAEGT